MPPSEKRKTLRRSLSYPAYIDLGDGSPLQDCLLCDASQEGAQLTVAGAGEVPNEFILALSADGAATRRCKVIWRTETQLGVEFLKDPRRSARFSAAAMAPSADADAEAGDAEAVQDTLDIDTLPKR